MTAARGWPWGLALFLAVIAVYTPVWWAGSIWDDGLVVTANPVVVGPLGLKEIWTTVAADVCPLTLTTFWCEHALWGLDLRAYHIVNIVMHGVCALLLWRVLLALRVPGAWIGAALWALHPVAVESVAWIAEMKNTESGLFFLLAILFFVKWRRASIYRGNLCALTMIFSALAMASKSSTVILPAVLCLVAWWMDGRWRWRNLILVAPVAAMAIIATAASVWSIDIQGRVITPFDRPWPVRLASAGDAVWFYLVKLVWPYPQMMIYAHWEPVSTVRSYLPLLALIVVLVILWLRRDTGARPYFFAFAYFVVALLPVLGFVDNYIFRYSLVFDHFQYLASMGPLALTGAGLAWLTERNRLALILSMAAISVFGLLSWQRTWVYQSETTLWNDEIAKYPRCWVAQDNLGWVFMREGEINAAANQFQQACTIEPGDAEAHGDLGFALYQEGQVGPAIIEYERALTINSHYAEAHSNLGNALMQQGHGAAALSEYQKALADNPHLAETRYNLGNALMKQGDFDGARTQFQQALQDNPTLAPAHTGLAIALAQKGDLDGAIDQFREVLELNPNSARAHNNLGFALLQKGQATDAVAEFRQALRLDPTLTDAQRNLDRALRTASSPSSVK